MILSLSKHERQALYPGLDGEWAVWADIARRFEMKVPVQDRQDVRHDILLELALARARDRHKPFSEALMCRIASFVVADYWRKQKHRPITMSLQSEPRGEDRAGQLVDTIADDRAIDLDAWLDAGIFLLGCPAKLVTIAHKKVAGYKLTPGDSQYLWRFRKREQKLLAAM